MTNVPRSMSSFDCWSVADEIEKAALSRQSSSVMLRLLFAILIAAAMLFAPFGMQSAMASTPDDHHGQMKSNGSTREAGSTATAMHIAAQQGLSVDLCS